MRVRLTGAVTAPRFRNGIVLLILQPHLYDSHSRACGAEIPPPRCVAAPTLHLAYRSVPKPAMNNTLDLSSMLDAASGSTPELTVTDPFTDDFPTPTAANDATALDTLDPSLMAWPMLDMETSNHSNITDSSARTTPTTIVKTESAADTRSSSSRSESVRQRQPVAKQPGSSSTTEQDKAKEKLAQRKLRNKESARRYREKQVARRRQLENFTRTLAEQNRELEALHDRLLALTCERRLVAGNSTPTPAHFAQVPVQNRSALPLQ